MRNGTSVWQITNQLEYRASTYSSNSIMWARKRSVQCMVPGFPSLPWDGERLQEHHRILLIMDTSFLICDFPLAPSMPQSLGFPLTHQTVLLTYCLLSFLFFQTFSATGTQASVLLFPLSPFTFSSSSMSSSNSITLHRIVYVDDIRFVFLFFPLNSLPSIIHSYTHRFSCFYYSHPNSKHIIVLPDYIVAF